MSDDEIRKYCKTIEKNTYLEFPENFFLDISEEQSNWIAGYFGHRKLMRLPEYEIDFFEWLKAADYPVWADLWESSGEEPYLVGASFLPMICDKTRGFPICDLLENHNYYFTESQMVDLESKIMLESVRELFLNNKSLTVAQLLILEISTGPIDIWHFAYKYNLRPDTAKKAVSQLVEDKIIVHFKLAEHVAPFVEF